VRVRVPRDLLGVLKCRELKQSLGTKERALFLEKPVSEMPRGWTGTYERIDHAPKVQGRVPKLDYEA
jgi:hypothetical protein